MKSLAIFQCLLLILSMYLAIYQVICTSSYAQDFYDISLKLLKSNTTMHKELQIIHLLRIPKAASSSLSIVARRGVGCVPRGPCCIYPGNPPGSCPSRQFYNCSSKVIGCVEHNANYLSLLNTSIHTISLMRQPNTRAISGYFYGKASRNNIHTNADCPSTLDDCFLQYTKDDRYRNVVVKLLTGVDAYSRNVKTCPKKKDCNNSLELALDNMKHVNAFGITEMWELSILLLHLKIPGIPPLFDDFNLVNEQSELGMRVNKDRVYKAFQTYATSKYIDELQRQNSLDLVLYKHVVKSMCNDLHTYKLWKHEVIKKYWREKSPIKTKRCR